MDRRVFLAASAALGTAAAETAQPALLGGKAVRQERFSAWPLANQVEEKALLAALRSGKWNRNTAVPRFEEEYAKLTGTAKCLAVANGTSALLVALNALGIGAGDEVIVPPYTFIATINTVLAQHALPVFVDTDPETFQIDASKIEAAITPRTAAILPVHMGGNAANLDAILAVAQKHKIPVLEDAAQAHLAEWRGKKVGSLGSMGCFSFQASKNLNSGEGGAIVSQRPELIERCYAFHNNSRGRGTALTDFSYRSRGLNLRLTDFQGAMLLAQMTRIEEQAQRRESNAAYLTKMLAEIPGIHAAKQYEGCTRNAFHLYMFRYEAQAFAGLKRATFLRAMAAEGIGVSAGYQPLNREPFLEETLATRGYQRLYSDAERKQWKERNHCPVNDRLCEQAGWLTQTMLLGPKEDMEQIATAIKKIQAHAPALAKL